MITMWLLGCGRVFAANQGELWLRIEDSDNDGNRVTLTFPASSLREPGEAATLQTSAGEVDLRSVARSMRVSTERSWTLADGDKMVLWHAAPATGSVTELSLAMTGPKGNGLTLSIPLQPDALDQQLHNKADIDIELGLPIGYDEVGCAQLRRSPPMPIAEIVGPKGNGLTISTR